MPETLIERVAELILSRLRSHQRVARFALFCPGLGSFSQLSDDPHSDAAVRVFTAQNQGVFL